MVNSGLCSCPRSPLRKQWVIWKTFPYPAADFRKAYERSLLFSEHTWGMAGFKPKPQPKEKRDLETNESGQGSARGDADD